MFRKFIAVAAVALLPAAASASSIVTAGNVKLGVDDYGQLNIPGGVADVAGETRVGVRWLDGGLEYESTSHGCVCEGWGVSVDGTTAGANNDDGGAFGLTLDSFTPGASTAESIVSVIGTDVKVTHTFQASASSDLMEVVVKIENTGATDIANIGYRRAMDWDTSPTPFNEYVTIGGTATTTALAASSTNGFLSSDMSFAIADTYGCGTVGTDYTACGPFDHGAVFDFDFGDLLAGETYTFSIFYGGAANKTAANAALGAVGAELFSYGWSGDDANQDGIGDAGTFSAGATTPTFIFAFKGVGGSVVIPTVPLPAAGWLLLAGLGAMAGMRRRKTA